jgi:fluoroacetyl-CoA thioesterase
MKETLRSGIEHSLRFRVPETKTVPSLYPESPEFQKMPVVFATGFMVGLIEWACIQAINQHIDWPSEQTVGTHFNISHSSPTPPGIEVIATVTLREVQGKRLVFAVEVRDELDLVSQGTHERFIIDAARFDAKLREKRNRVTS